MSDSDLPLITIEVELDDETFEIAKERKYNLCFLRDVEVDGKVEKGNIVFASIPNKDVITGMVTVISYQEKYQVFGTKRGFEYPGQTVWPDTNQYELKSGQTAIFQKDGDCTITGEGSSGEPLHVVNESKIPYIGVRGYLPSTKTYSSFYVPHVPVKKNDYTPLRSFGIFWAPDMETNTTIDVDRSDIFHFNMSMAVDSIRLQYTGPSWKIGKRIDKPSHD